LARIFLSYAREDFSKAKALAGGIERHGHEVWWDRRILGGSRFAQQIEAALNQADVVLVLWSRFSIESAWVQDEAAAGRDTDRLLPVAVDESCPPLGFRQYQSIDLSHWNGRPNHDVAVTVAEAIAGKSGADAKEKGEDLPPPQLPSVRKLRPPDRAMLGGALAVLLVLAGGLYLARGPADGPDPESLRVRLAEFTNLSADLPPAAPAMLREELLAALGTDAHIIASTKQAAPSEEAAAFAVNASVRKVSDALRFTIHLASEQSGDTLWTGTFDRPAASSEVAPRQAAIAASQVLRCGLIGKSQYPRALPDETLATYLTYCQEYHADSAGNIPNPNRGLDLARRIVQATPDFSRGWSARALMANWAAYDASGGAASQLRSESEQAANRAIELDDKNSEAYAVLANLMPHNDYAGREKLYIKSVSVRPSDCGCEIVGLAYFMADVGRDTEALQSLKRAHDQVPFSADVNSSLAELQLMTGHIADARETVRTIEEVWPKYGWLPGALVRSALWTGQYDEAMAILADPDVKFSDKERQYYANAFRALRSGDAAAKAAAVGQLQQLGRDAEADKTLLISTLAALGANREALGMVASTLGSRGSPYQYILFDPPLAAARRTPEFALLVERIGLVRYWRQSRHAPDFCRERNAPPLCRTL
jgi:hypothetical protein